MATKTGTGKGLGERQVGGLPITSRTSLSLSRVFVAETARSLSGLDEDVTRRGHQPHRSPPLSPPPPCEASGLRVVPE
ncbi:hypothetical protein ACIA5C_01200 [Actinoplanes sp. NPDC051343]|uniref:hypothetical protein n=1 Tax=Actinoplanes sp. NPDC051343 TaxID=3363906 RepID=UPI00378CF35D